jgi:hypothetical protein
MQAPNGQQLSVFAQTLAAQEQAATVVPQNLRRSIQSMVRDLSLEIRPTGFTTTAKVALPVIPPKLEAAERPITIVFDRQDAVAVEQLLYLKLVFDIDLLHRRILLEKPHALNIILPFPSPLLRGHFPTKR